MAAQAFKQTRAKGKGRRREYSMASGGDNLLSSSGPMRPFSLMSSVPTAEPTVSSDGYRTAPLPSTDMPPGIPYIIGNEAAERFSFYGMRAILVTFMTTYLLNRSGALDVMSKNDAQGWVHQFVAAVYFTPFLGAILSDGFLGKYRTILSLSVIYCLGHLALAINDTRLGLAVGLTLIALGAGGIKPCVSAHVGDQFGASNQHLLTRAFGWFYFSINVGASVSIWLCPILLESKRFGPHYAFGLPGVLMLAATVVFWMGRKKFVHIPPAGSKFVREFFSRDTARFLGRLAIIFVFIPVFWALWDQSSGAEWTIQAKSLDLNFLGIHFLAGQVQVVNGIFVLLFIPVFNYGLYPAISRVFPLTPLRKIGIGLFLTALSFVVIWWLQSRIDAGERPNVGWQILAYAILTAAEVMVSITGLELAYTQAPNKMKSFVMALWMLTVTVGNQFTAALNFLKDWLQSHGFNLEGAAYYRFFTLFMLVTAVIFVIVSRFYRYETHIQDETEKPAVAEP
jgi:POT family proton-dependent oligopeptide transporter